ncbi:MAG: aspartate/tyrosine/aromatic aminotransferase [Congregibacter sp.]|jgi:aspartate aminotransferase|nr:aspartate/tyrosine/aromatic aminotransferase [Congregibacter sp.]
MFDSLPVLPPDSILGLAAACRADPNPDKVDLTLGVYMDETGLCPVFEAVQQAQQALVSEEQTKVYMPPQGDPDYLTGIRSLVFGEAGMADLGDRISAVQTPGGCGAVRLGAEVLHAAAPDATVWVSDPTWPVHIPLMGSVGLQFKTYRYYSADMKGLDFDAMLADLETAQAGDVVLLHGCCHNPSGVDPTLEQWGVLADLMSERQLLPMIDFAYQGMGAGLDEDAAGIRAVLARVPEMIVAVSSSKNIGLYRERAGAVVFVGGDARAAEAMASQAVSAARRVYSMPPAHGALLAGRVLSSPALRSAWEAELGQICERINGLRGQLQSALTTATKRDFGFIGTEHGMFSFLGLSVEQAQRLREEQSVYMLDSSRINIAGLNANNLGRVAEAVASVL